VDYIDRLKQFFQRVESGYIDGHPLHIADPDRSGFAIITAEKFWEMPPHEVQELIRRKNVVVTGCEHPELKFDEAGLRTLAPLDSQVSILGLALINVWLVPSDVCTRFHVSIVDKGSEHDSCHCEWPGQ
jgi:hypothetical protein